MKSLNNKANARFMRLIDQMAGQSELCHTINGEQPLTLSLLATDIFSSSVNNVGNLYKLIFSDTSDGKSQNPGMDFLVFDRRIEKSDLEAVQIFPVSYRNDILQEDEKIVSIVNNQVWEVNNNSQHKYVRFANQWLKTLDERGYMVEMLQEATTEEDLVCVCGNNSQFNGFAYCDASGNIIELRDPVKTHCICRGCNRIINLETFEVVAIANVTPPTEISLVIHKPIVNMSEAEKAKLLHVLCPDAMRGFLTFVNDTAQAIIDTDKLSTQSLFNESLSLSVWKELAKNASQIITTLMNRLVNDSDLFAKVLFVGYTKTFLMHCIQKYLIHCQNERAVRGIEFIFDL